MARFAACAPGADRCGAWPVGRTAGIEIYTHEDRQAHREALGRISEALIHDSESPPAAEEGGETGEADGQWVSNVGVNRSANVGLGGVLVGAPGRIRTRDPLLRSYSQCDRDGA